MAFTGQHAEHYYAYYKFIANGQVPIFYVSRQHSANYKKEKKNRNSLGLQLFIYIILLSIMMVKIT